MTGLPAHLRRRIIFVQSAEGSTGDGYCYKGNIDRYMKIAGAFAARGACQGDPKAAVAGGMKNRRRKDYNDVGWKIWGGNYGRFLEQLAPGETSVAWWHVGPADHHYSRFGRGFDHANGKTVMPFSLDRRFFAGPDRARAAAVRVAYLDRGKGSWALAYAGPGGKKRAMAVRCGDTGKWIDRRIDLPDAHFTGALRGGADLMLEYLAGDDTVFHMIEVDRR